MEPRLRRERLTVTVGRVERSVYDIHEEPAAETYERLIAWLFDRAEMFVPENRPSIVGELGQAGVRPGARSPPPTDRTERRSSVDLHPGLRGPSLLWIVTTTTRAPSSRTT